jgi:hypothetical protein
MGLPHFFGKLLMAAPTPPRSKHRYWLVFFGLLSIALFIVMATLAYLFFTLGLSDTRDVAPTIAATTPTGSRLSLPTASNPTVTSGLPVPKKIDFVAQEPIKGFSNCQEFGVMGTVTTGNGKRLQGVQIVVWEDKAGLLGLDSSDAEGRYGIAITAATPTLHKLWVQVYENDLPVSEAVLVETQIDCQIGFQVYEIDWLRVTVKN